MKILKRNIQKGLVEKIMAKILQGLLKITSNDNFLSRGRNLSLLKLCPFSV